MRSDIKSKGAKISYVFQVAYGSLCELQLFAIGNGTHWPRNLFLEVNSGKGVPKAGNGLRSSGGDLTEIQLLTAIVATSTLQFECDGI